MPELAEVEWFRRQWDCGRGQTIQRVALHEKVRVFRFTKPNLLLQLAGAKLLGSDARGKLMLFRFSRGHWLGLHLGMTGRLQVAPADLVPGKHDHLVLFQQKRALIFTDSRQFGAVRFHVGKSPPGWWQSLGPSVLSREFSARVMKDFLGRHPRLPIKGSLLLQGGFPGIGNWMADEVLWHAKIHPKVLTAKLSDKAATRLWRDTRKICRQAVRAIAERNEDPPKGWLFHERWGRAGKCPRDGSLLERSTVAGRTTVWCYRCQR